METKLTSFMKEILLAEPESFLEQFLLPFVITAITLVIVSYFMTPYEYLVFDANMDHLNIS